MDIDIPITCPSCSRKLTKKLSSLKANTELACACGQRFKVDGKEFERAAAALKDLSKSLNKLGR